MASAAGDFDFKPGDNIRKLLKPISCRFHVN
jgi:hypothetical protein